MSEITPHDAELSRAGHFLSVYEKPLACLVLAYPEVLSQELDNRIGRRPARQRLANPPRNLEQPVAVGWDACHGVLERFVDERHLAWTRWTNVRPAIPGAGMGTAIPGFARTGRYCGRCGGGDPASCQCDSRNATGQQHSAQMLCHNLVPSARTPQPIAVSGNTQQSSMFRQTPHQKGLQHFRRRFAVRKLEPSTKPGFFVS